MRFHHGFGRLATVRARASVGARSAIAAVTPAFAAALTTLAPAFAALAARSAVRALALVALASRFGRTGLQAGRAAIGGHADRGVTPRTAAFAARFTAVARLAHVASLAGLTRLAAFAVVTAFTTIGPRFAACIIAAPSFVAARLAVSRLAGPHWLTSFGRAFAPALLAVATTTAAAAAIATAFAPAPVAPRLAIAARFAVPASAAFTFFFLLRFDHRGSHWGRRRRDAEQAL